MTSLDELAEMGMTQEELLAIDAEVDARLGENYSVNRRFALQQIDLIEEGFMHARDGSTIRPEFYGGLAIDDDGMPIIFIVESRKEEAYGHDTVGALLDEGLRYRLVDVSYDELLETLHAISAITATRYINYRCVYSYNMGSLFTDMMMNKVVVGLVEYNERMVDGFRRYVYDSPVIVIQQGGRSNLGGGHGGATFLIAIMIGAVILIIGMIVVIIKKHTKT